MKYDNAMVVGRFQPYHIQHHALISHALTVGNQVIVVLGSAKSAPDVKNPFTPIQREEMIRACFDEETNKRLKFYGVRDYPYNDNLWLTEVQNIAHENLIEKEGSTLALVGHFKDESSYYLKLFPQWKLEQFEGKKLDLNATDIRASYFEERKEWLADVPEAVRNYLQEFSNTESYQTLKREYEYLKKYKADTRFVGASYSPTFVTTDALVVAMGHVLVVQRGHQPGKGCLALPGGFLAERYKLVDNAIKELKEETSIRVDPIILKNSIVAEKVFDHPNRSLRGRTITHAFHIVLNPKMENGLPTVKGGDDADKAMWIPIASLRNMEDKFFEDHIQIVRHFLGF